VSIASDYSVLWSWSDKVASAQNGGLNKVAKLDTTVTVVDGFRFFEEFETIQLLHERFQSEVETPEDQRTVSDLMIDQIEFADVIIINKVSGDSSKQSSTPLTFVRSI
jgi:G3E family GTPase